jgi:hypothetical protein
MKNNKITVVFDKVDASRFEEISNKTKWEDKILTTMLLRYFYKRFKDDWKKTMTDALEEEANDE